MSKFHSQKTIIDNTTFDSKKEADKYCELKLLKRAGEVKEFVLQPVFELQPKFTVAGKTLRAIKYVADFRVTWADGSVEVIDTKGYKTKEYCIKKKLFLFRYPDVKFTEE